MECVGFILALIFFSLLLLNVPVAVAIGSATMLGVAVAGGTFRPEIIVPERMMFGINSFPLLAIPFFVLSGILMGRGGMARRLIDFASALVGHLPGGLAYANTITCMLFGSISGSAGAAVASVGGFMVPEMVAKGYDRNFSTALTTTSATTGLVIPPSNIMIVYAVACGSVSIAAMFLAGVIPGIVMGLCIILACVVHAVRSGAKFEKRVPFSVLWTTFRRAFLSLFLMVIIIGGILKGIFTATEAAAVAVAYAFVLSVFLYREVKFRDLPGILKETGITTAVVMFLIGVSSSMSWIMTVADIPGTVSAWMISLSSSPVVILAFINILLLVVGAFMDMTPAVLIFTPIFLPIVREFGMSDIQFGIMMIANLCIGLCTPPVGTCLFIGCGIGKTSIAKVTPSMIPFWIAMVVSVVLITSVPFLSNGLPSLLGK
ncbi:MAG: TRAP transporter large permease [Lentisphaeria bacterium]|nr:TRAP transporter large permease [Lentisphaeria bacterium]